MEYLVQTDGAEWKVLTLIDYNLTVDNYLESYGKSQLFNNKYTGAVLNWCVISTVSI